ncbi:hypothetical protein FQN49_001070 [Arthroderma sp. PD_2]|nr:hypothetical protein FQN49_001070 [Arthroderma sp. PD_2]
MELLKRPWIEPLVESAIRQSIDTGGRVDNSKELGETVNDGSNFRIPGKRPKYVQLVKWVTKNPIPQAVLSDAFAMIHAIFSERARLNYEKEYDTDVRSNSIGNLLRISKFQITIGQLRTRPPEVYLYIEEMKTEGCEGSGIIGNPTDVARCKTIVELGNKWANETRDTETRSVDESNDTSDDSDSESIISQPNPDSIHEDENPEPEDDEDANITQEGRWYTQVPTHAVAQKAKAKGTEDFAPLPTTKAQDLLNVLKPKRPSSGHKSPTNSSARRSSQVLDGRKPDSTPRAVSGSPIPNPKNGGISGKEPHRTIPPSPKIHSQCGQSPPASVNEIGQNSPVDSHKPDQLPGTSGPIPFQAVEVAIGKQHTRSDKTKNPHSLRSSEVPSVAENGRVDNRGFFSGWNKIHHHDVFISKSQQKLIESPDSWIPPDTGMRIPQGFVPINLIQEWNDRHRKMAALARRAPLSEGQASDIDAEPPSSPTSSQLPDDQLGSELWPASSPVPRVPLDSSPPNKLGRSSLRFHEDTPDPDPVNPADVSTTSQITAPTNSAPEAGTLPDRGSYNDSEMDLSIPKDLYTSTQEHIVPPGSSMAENEGVDTANLSPLPTKITETILSQQSQLQYPLPSHGPVTPSPRHQRIGSSTISSPNATTILVPATSKVGAQKPQSRSSLESTHNPTVGSPVHDSIPQNSSLGYDGMIVGAQLPTALGGAEPSDSTALPGVLQVPESSLEIVDQAMAVLPSIETYVPPLQPEETNRKRKRTEETPSRSSSRKVSRMSEAISRLSEGNISSTSRQSKKIFEQASFSSQTEEIYYKFQQAYKAYSGSLETFRKACWGLQVLRNKGFMKKSMLWDDFIAREVTEYQQYISRCHQRQKTPDTYEGYFQKHAKFAQYKRRNLTVKNLQTVVIEAEGEFDSGSDSGGEGEGDVRSATTPEPPATLSRVIQESPCKPGVRDWESEASGSESDTLDPDASYMHDRASVELGDEDVRHIAPSNLKIREVTPLEEEDEDEEDIVQAGHGLLPPPTSARMNNRSHLNPPIELGADRVLRSKSYSKTPKHPTTPPRRDSIPPQTRMRQQTSHIGSKPSRSQRSPVPSLPSHRKLRVEKDSTATSASPKDPDTSVMRFFREYARLPCELSIPTPNLDSHDVPVDNSGVALLNPPKRRRKGGRMGNMGFKFQ